MGKRIEKARRENEISRLIIAAVRNNPRIKMLMYMQQKFQNTLWTRYGVSVFNPQGERIEDRELYVLYNHIVKLENEIKWFFNGYYPEPFQNDSWSNQKRYFIQSEKGVQQALEHTPEFWRGGR